MPYARFSSAVMSKEKEKRRILGAQSHRRHRRRPCLDPLPARWTGSSAPYDETIKRMANGSTLVASEFFNTLAYSETKRQFASCWRLYRTFPTLTRAGDAWLLEYHPPVLSPLDFPPLVPR